jgi:hypothetical protein
MPETPETGAQLALARQRFREAVHQTTDGVRRHTGLRLGPAWVLPLVAAAAGLTGAWALRRRRQKRVEGSRKSSG